jgi:hypothetical protein
MLISVPADRCDALLAKLKDQTPVAVVIGEVVEREDKALVVVA